MKDNKYPPPGNGGKKTLYSNPDRPPAVPAVCPAGIPAALKEVLRWVLWLFTWKANKDGTGKWDKVPKTVRGTNASSVDPKGWSTFDAAAAYQAGKFSGIGFVLGDGFIGIDLDDVRNPATGELVPWAGELVTTAGTYADVSPSGTGVKLFGRGEWAGNWHKRPHPSGVGEIEVYSAGRYFTITGHTAGGIDTVGIIQPTLDSLVTLFDFNPMGGGSSPSRAEGGCTLTDDELLDRIRCSKHGLKFDRLWTGDTSEYCNDDSAADLALCSMVAFWCGLDAARIDRLFRRSGRMRAKWDSKRGNTTYGRMTVQKAIGGKTDFHRTSDGVDVGGTITPPIKPSWPDPPAGEVYHGLAGEVVRALDPFTEADPVAVLVQLLVLFGNLIGRGPHYAVGGDRHFTNEFAVLVGPTGGGRKGTSAGMVNLALNDIDAEWLDGRNVSGVSSGEGLLWAVRDPIMKRERVAQGRGSPPEYEEVEADPGVADKRLMVQEPEFAGVLKQTERSGNTASAALRQLWDGRAVVQSLTKNSPAKATGAHISLVGHITPEELHRYLTATESANGFANRFLFACVRQSKLLPDGGRVAPDLLTPLRLRLAGAAEFARAVGEVRRHPSADAIWRAVYPLLTRDRHGLAGALTARAAPHVLRLAVLYALLDLSATIRPSHLLAGIALWDYCERSVEHLFAGRTGNPLADDIRDLLRAAPAGLTRTELVAAFGRHQHGDKLTAALVVLEGAGLARRETVSTGGRPAERWHANAGRGDSSPLMATARATTGRGEGSGEGDESDAATDPPADFDRFDRIGRTAGPEPQPAWEDPEQMYALLQTRGWTWGEALAWLDAPATAVFFELPPDRRQRLAAHLERQPPVTNSNLGK